MEKHFCENDECGKEIKFGGAEPQTSLRVVVEFVRSTKDERPLRMGYGSKISEDSLGKLEFCCKDCAIKHLTKDLKKWKEIGALSGK